MQNFFLNKKLDFLFKYLIKYAELTITHHIFYAGASILTRNHPATRSELQYIQSIADRETRACDARKTGKSNKISRAVSNKRVADLFLVPGSQQQVAAVVIGAAAASATCS